MSDLTDSFQKAWDEALEIKDQRIRDMMVGSLAASVSDWGNDLSILKDKLWKEYIDSRTG